MKLRNKKTGKVFDVIVREKSNGDGEYSIIVCNLRAIRSGRSVSSILGEYDSLAKLNENWEDYEPAEPLIKDEKIRKGIRAWAEANGIKEIIIFDYCNNAPYTPVGAVEFAGNASRFKVLFRTGERFDTNRIYTIAELCGEEEKEE